MEIIAFTLDLIGKILVSFNAIMVHHRVAREHKIDKQVFEEMRRERNLGLLGIVCMIAGYVIHLKVLL